MLPLVDRVLVCGVDELWFGTTFSLERGARGRVPVLKCVLVMSLVPDCVKL